MRLDPIQPITEWQIHITHEEVAKFLNIDQKVTKVHRREMRWDKYVSWRESLDENESRTRSKVSEKKWDDIWKCVENL